MDMDRRSFNELLAAGASGGILGFHGLVAGIPAAAKGDDVSMILIPASKTTIGTSGEEIETLARTYDVHPSWFVLEQPERDVETGAFLIDRFPVTNAEFLEYAVEADVPDWWNRAAVEREIDKVGALPVTGVHIAHAEGYAAWAGKRLPTAEEWEYTAGGSERLVYPWGNEWDPSRCNANEGEKPYGRGPTRMDAYPGGASPFGVMDMTGNVSEWTATRHGASNVVKGGHWRQSLPFIFRCAYRGMTQIGSNQQDYIGFRCARDVSGDREDG